MDKKGYALTKGKTHVDLRAINGAKKFLNLKGNYKILADGWIDGDDFIGLVVLDEQTDSIAFIDCWCVHDFEQDRPNRRTFERLLCSYVSQHPDIAEHIVRFDTIQIAINNNNNLGVVRHHVNALNEDSDTEWRKVK